MKKLASFAVLALSVSTAGPAAAAAFTNGSFEQPAGVVTLAMHAGSTFLPGWTVVDATPGGDDDVQYTSNGAFGGLGVVASDGAYFLDLTGNVGRGKGVASSLIDVVVGQTYRVAFDVGAFFVRGQGSYGNATVDLLVNDVAAGSFTNTLGLTTPGSDWERFSYEFTATGATAKLTFLSSTALTSSNLGVGLDKVTFDRVVTAPGVPEPSTWALLLAGFGGAGAMLRARRRTAIG